MSRVAPPPASSSSRTIAPLPHHASQATSSPAAPTQQPARRSAYSSDLRQLHAGGRNRFFLSLRSGVDEEVDYALPRLVVASYENHEAFKLDTWIDSVGALKEWPEKWLDQLEKEAAAAELRQGTLPLPLEEDGENGLNGHSNPEETILLNGSSDADARIRGLKRKRNLALGAIPEWTADPIVEQRATNSLLVLRNASCTPSNATIICRKSFLSFLDRFFSLPPSFILDLSLRSPEPLHYILTIVQLIYPEIPSTHEIRRIFGTVLPELLVQTRDQALMLDLLPLMISGLTMPNLPSPPDTLIPHLLQLLVLRPAPALLELTLDLLISFTLNPIYARSILAQPKFPAHLKSLVILLEYAARPLPVSWDSPQNTIAVMYRNPAGASVLAEQAESRRTAERAAAQQDMEAHGGQGVFVEVGEKPPVLSAASKSKLYSMREPARSIAWMHETFVYSSNSQLLQVTFWHAYRDFFTNPATVEQLLSASDVIKNVTIAFPGAMARVIQDEMGGNKFVIAGMGFRKAADDDHRFSCLWKSCEKRGGATNPGQLLSHIQATHLDPTSIPQQCQWHSCTHSPLSVSHILTHLPLSTPVQVPDLVSSHPSVPEINLMYPKITSRPVPPLSKAHRLHFTAMLTQSDSRRHPIGAAFLASLMIRNLARTLRSEIVLAEPDDDGEQSTSLAKKQHLLEERFGLPIPDSVLREEEEEERVAGIYAKSSTKEGENGLGETERERAREAFANIEERVAQVVSTNMSGIGQYLGEAFGW